MACLPRSPALLEPSTSSSCCCSVSAWRAPRTMTGSLANTPDSHTNEFSSRRSFLRLKSDICKPYIIRRKLSCQGNPEMQNTDVYSFSALWDNLKCSISYLSQVDLTKVKDAFKLAFEAHSGQKRRSGEPYIIHPVEVAKILGELEMDWESVAAGLLHDTAEDTDLVTFEMLEEDFGFNVRRIVEGETKVSKLGKIQGSSDRDVKADDLRQMFLAMTEEVRVIIVKLADRLHNMRTLSFMPLQKQKHIALETLQIFAPLARLLGIYKLKSELEELSFMYAYPTEYLDLKRRVEAFYKNQREMVMQAKEALTQALLQDQFLTNVVDGIKISTPCKELYSVFKKLKILSSEEIKDVAQVRIVLQPKADDRLCNAKQVCYHVLGLVHSLWPPVPQTMKDYIATPKPNGYQSLHTKVIPFGSKTFYPLEIQIRTDKMDIIAEYGITVHYSGKTGSQSSQIIINGNSGKPLNSDCLNAADLARRVSWLHSIRQWQEEFVGNMTSREFVDTVTGDLLGSRIFVFSPKGEIKNLPRGATVIDYAYQLHTDVGNKMVAAKVNGKLVSPTHVLSNAEVVEILTYEGLSNKKQFLRHKRWLQFARTRSARHKLTKFLKEQAFLSAIELTADAVKKFLSNSDSEDIDGDDDQYKYSPGLRSRATDQPSTSKKSYYPKLLPAQDAMMHGGRLINGKHNNKRGERLGRGTCIVGSAAHGFFNITGIPFQEEPSRTLEDWLMGRVISWHGLGISVQWFSISCLDRKNVLAEVTAALGASGILICACVAETDRMKGLGTMIFQVEGSTEDLLKACSDLELIEGVLNWSLGCSWQPPDMRQHIQAQYEA